MLQNYIKIAWRNIWKNRLFSFINIISLSIGISASLVIGMMVYYESTFDNFHKDGNLIYRVTSDFLSKDGSTYNSGVPIPLINSIKQDVSGLKAVAPFFLTEPSKVTDADQKSLAKNPDGVIYADDNYFKIFDYRWLAGNKNTALKGSNEVVLTQSRAQKYFPKLSSDKIIGKTIFYNDSIATKIVGVVADFTKRTDLTFKEFISTRTAMQTEVRQELMGDNWNSTSSSNQLFIKLNNAASFVSLKNQLAALAKKHESDDAKKYGSSRQFHLQPLRDIHFNANYGTFDSSGVAPASKTVLTSLIIVALFLLLLGCINFINLNTAQATQRAKEIGVRKTLGSSKNQLILQFLGETFLLTLFATLLSLFFALGLLKAFADFIPVGLTFNLILNPFILAYLISLVIVVALFSGFYPALMLTRFKPVAVLKGQINKDQSRPILRQSLTVFQFVIAQVFIMATFLVGKQIHFLLTKNMGFKTDAIAYVSIPWNDRNFNKRELLLQKIEAIPQIAGASLAGAPPASSNTNSTDVDFEDGKKQIHTSLQFLFGDKNYLGLYDLKLLAGKNLQSDTIKEYVINETMLHALGFKNPQDAIGKQLTGGRSSIPVPIVGVIADFNQRSLHAGIEPMALIGDWSRTRFSQFRFVHFSLEKKHPENWAKAIEKIHLAFKEIYPGEDFDATFLDDTVKNFYKSETRLSSLLNWATGLSILISCLGLLGLVIHTTEKRTKEIGIRKVLGASVLQLAKLLSVDFLALVGLAFLIALPIAWWGSYHWLQDFVYKTQLSWWVFVLSGLGMMLIALLIMSFKTIKTANENPVKSLRTE